MYCLFLKLPVDSLRIACQGKTPPALYYCFRCVGGMGDMAFVDIFSPFFFLESITFGLSSFGMHVSFVICVLDRLSGANAEVPT